MNHNGCVIYNKITYVLKVLIKRLELENKVLRRGLFLITLFIFILKINLKIEMANFQIGVVVVKIRTSAKQLLQVTSQQLVTVK